MKKWIILLSLSCGLIVNAAEPIAIIKSVKGEVSVKRNNAYIPAQKGESLLVKDLIQTGDGSTIGLSFNDGTVISLGPKSMLVVDDYLFKPASNEYNFDLNLKKGTSVFESGKIGKMAPQKVTFRVPQGSIGIRGTKFLVEAE